MYLGYHTRLAVNIHRSSEKKSYKEYKYAYLSRHFTCILCIRLYILKQNYDFTEGFEKFEKKHYSLNLIFFASGFIKSNRVLCEIFRFLSFHRHLIAGV